MPLLWQWCAWSKVPFSARIALSFKWQSCECKATTFFKYVLCLSWLVSCTCILSHQHRHHSQLIILQSLMQPGCLLKWVTMRHGVIIPWIVQYNDSAWQWQVYKCVVLFWMSEYNCCTKQEVSWLQEELNKIKKKRKLS